MAQRKIPQKRNTGRAAPPKKTEAAALRTSATPGISVTGAPRGGVRVLITGAAGYVGGMLCDQFSKRHDVGEVIGLDKDPMPDFLKNNAKLIWIQANTSDGTWQKKAAERQPEIVIHAAWQIRAMYGQSRVQCRWNIDGSAAVFNFAFSEQSVRKLIHFSTASSYGAHPSNSLTHHFTESEPLRDESYQYAAEKKRAEEILRGKYEERIRAGKRVPAVFVVRPTTITGPRGRYMFDRFGLMATLRNRLPSGAAFRVISLLINRLPIASEKWCRQILHEDDLADAIEALAFRAATGARYEVFNLTPPGPPVLGRDMARIAGKKTIRIPPFLVRLGFFVFWHLTRGKVATAPGGWKYYCYPIVMDGSRITRAYGVRYRYSSREALANDEGRYAVLVSPKITRGL